MNRIIRKIIIVLSLLCAIALLCFIVTAFLGSDIVLWGREYQEDVVYELPEDGGSLIIRKWTFLVGSGAEIYYKNNQIFRTEVFLGEINNSGPIDINVVDKTEIHIRWCREHGGWTTDVFEIPEELPLAWWVIALPIGLLLTGGIVTVVVLVKKKKKQA